LKSKIILGTMLGLLLIASTSFAEDDADKKRLLKEYEKMQAEKAKEAEKLAKEQAEEAERLAKEQAESGTQTTEVTEVVTENGEVVAVEEQVAQAEENMKKLAILALGVLSLVACTDQKLVAYNTARLDNIETYLKENKFVKPSENLDKELEEGKVAYTEEYISLEKEAKKWEREKSQQQ